ncbi:uncharacterized protein RAG0_12579 [Rhynchosporium agropyri]|uniref:Potassium channel tetramerisation-type BTB domain-containing protein n=1 Tax=Rhynchosporium agropyri TaxID=914238 RepID=A0A1E1L8X6_9HELO|nr:uncharacterized protein RAG0_12579 [Rhynchosporium agropyri]
MYTTIRTSQRNFTTDPERCLGQSMYFKSLFSGKWGDRHEDGSYFIETDAHIFEHILRYLRTGVLPVFYDRAEGHDFALYQALLEEAKYFVVEIHYLATETQDRGSSRKQTTSDPEGHTFMVEDRFVEIYDEWQHGDYNGPYGTTTKLLLLP